MSFANDISVNIVTHGMVHCPTRHNVPVPPEKIATAEQLLEAVGLDSWRGLPKDSKCA